VYKDLHNYDRDVEKEMALTETKSSVPYCDEAHPSYREAVRS
jgi:hypothetical protein